MKRWIACATIAVYLSALGYGLLAHAVQYRVGAHPAMYFVVWDMFCGWSGYSQRMHLIAEGESGRYYQVTPTPWGAYHPFSDLGREHYDSFGQHSRVIAANCLRHTRHEPIMRVLLVEESWSKKHNVPEQLQSRLSDDPLRKRTYCHIRDVYSADGSVMHRGTDWLSERVAEAAHANPRLRATVSDSSHWIMSSCGPRRAGLSRAIREPLAN